MQRRVLVGAAATAAAVVGSVVADFLTDADLLVAVLLAGVTGGVVAGALSEQSGHVGAGARAGALGGAAGFVGFVVVGVAQSAVAGEFSLLLLVVQNLLVALLVVPFHALSGAAGAAVGVRMRRPTGDGAGS